DDLEQDLKTEKKIGTSKGSCFPQITNRPSFALPEMFQSCSGPDSQWTLSERDESQPLHDCGPHPHSWPQIYQSDAIHRSGFQHPYGQVYTRPQAPAVWQYNNTWKVGGHNRRL
ncbi:hypothetical protein ATANTOWER_032311, partial [Ataeniobius toweri]|nr:hypothetical protein [Ataeniobius toweri]